MSSLDSVTQPLVFTDLSGVSDQTGLARAYYILLQKALPALRLSLTRVGYDGSVFPLIGGGVFDQFLPATFLLLLLRAKSDLVGNNNSTREGRTLATAGGNQLRAPSTIPLRRTRSASNKRGAPARRDTRKIPQMDHYQGRGGFPQSN